MSSPKRRFGADSATSYVWIHHIEPETFPEASYAEVAGRAAVQWDIFREQYEVPYFPNATMGWDPSPRCDPSKPPERGEYPYTPILSGNSPAAFESSLRDVRSFLDRTKLQPPMLTVYAWNEWTEGGYLEPDTVHGMKYLEAIRNVFGPSD